DPRVERDPGLRALLAAPPRVVVVLPVDEEQVARRGLAVGAELAAFEGAWLQHRYEPRNRLHEAELAAVRARQRVDLVAGDAGADPVRGGFHERRFGRDDKRFGDTREGQR